MAERQHDDHIWMTVYGRGWAIRAIERDAAGMPETIHFWRGYEPDLEFLDVEVSDPDWPGYCDACVAMLEEVFHG